MIELNNYEEEALRQVLAWVSEGKDIQSEIRNQLNNMSESYQDSMGAWHVKENSELQSKLEVYDSLARKGILHRAETRGAIYYHGLTPDGHSYLEDKASAALKRRRAQTREMRFQSTLVIIGTLLSLVIGYIGQKVAVALDGEASYKAEMIVP